MTRTQQPDDSLLTGAWASLAVFATLAGVVGGLTLLFFGMRSVMEVGGACAEGGPYVSAQPCPDGVPLATFGGIWGGIIFLGLYIWACARYRVPSLVGLAWPALFLSLGWNFLEFGLDPPGDGGGLAWGWLVCAVLFGLMGAGPLFFVFTPTLKSFSPKDPQGPVTLRESMVSLRPSVASAARATRVAAKVAAPPVPADLPDDLVAALERLAALHRSGSLTDDEFARAKARLLEGTT